MTLNEHYKFHSRKSIKPYASLLFLIVLCASLFHTFAKYASIANTNSVIYVAKWNVLINGQQISNGINSLTNSIDLLNTLDDTTKIDAGDECYFDLIINPTLTEVAISYNISLDLTSQNNTLPSGTKIKKYEKYIGSTYQLDSTTNVNATSVSISEDINLPVSQNALSASDIRKIRIYCILPEFINVQKDQEYSVIPEIEIKQKINSN